MHSRSISRSRAGLLGGTTGYVYAVDGVTFSVDRGETLSIVGESGCGKSTVGKAILRLIEPTDGEVFLDGERIDNLPLSKLRPVAAAGAGGVPGPVQQPQPAPSAWATASPSRS